jgi:uncharacterized protein (UPF0333 family)
MKAQVSLEYLLVSVIAVALLTISVASLAQIKDYAERSGRLLEFRSSAESLGDAAYSVCMLGSGNRRDVFLRTAMDVQWENGVMRISNASSMASAVPCEVAGQKGIEGFVEVKNENGKVKIREY